MYGRRFSVKTQVAIALCVMTVGVISLLVVLDVLPISAFVGILALWGLEIIKCLFLLKRFSISNGKNIGSLVLMAECVSFLTVLCIMLLLAIPYDETKAPTLLAFSAAFFLVRGAGTLFISGFGKK